MGARPSRLEEMCALWCIPTPNILRSNETERTRKTCSDPANRMVSHKKGNPKRKRDFVLCRAASAHELQEKDGVGTSVTLMASPVSFSCGGTRPQPPATPARQPGHAHRDPAPSQATPTVTQATPTGYPRQATPTRGPQPPARIPADLGPHPHPQELVQGPVLHVFGDDHQGFVCGGAHRCQGRGAALSRGPTGGPSGPPSRPVRVPHPHSGARTHTWRRRPPGG